MELSVSLNFRGQAGPMTNRGVFFQQCTKIDWSNHLNGYLIAFIVCVLRCVIPPLFRISWLHSPNIYDAHNPP